MIKKLSCLLLLLPCICLATPISKPLTVVLDWFPNPNHAPLFVAQQQGFFKKLGLNIHFIQPSDPSDPPKLVAAGKADLALDFQPQFTLQVAKGLPLVRIATLIATPLTSIMVLKSSHVTSIKQLKGKTIAASPNSILLSIMLKNNGLSMKDVTIVNIGYNIVQALMSKKVAAANGMDRNFELLEIKQLGQQPIAFYPEENGIPFYNGIIIVANKNHLNDPRLPLFVKALTEGVQYLINHPKSSWRAFAKNHPEDDNSLNYKAWFATLYRFDLSPGALNKNRFTTFTHFLQHKGYIKKMPPLQDYAVQLRYN
jgi:putative hydroxymethylpyrimidine transport system substrate-binding protein